MCKTTHVQTSEIGLRERKRVETRARLETAAVELTLRDGIEHATVDAICEAADVSTRTFFNYFDSKEDAIVGIKDTAITESAVAEALEGSHGVDAIELTIRVMFGVLTPSVASSKLQKSRIKILKAHPEMLGRVAAQFFRMTEQLTVALQPLLAELPEFRDQDPEESTISAELLLSLCSGALRSSMKQWTTSGNSAPIEAVEQRAIELVRNTVKRIA
jgi:AcrR family transcriptional regulator